MPFCQEIEIFYGNKSVTVQVVDECDGCGPNDLGERHDIDVSAPFHSLGFSSADLSPAAFKDLAPLSEGEIDIKWEFA
jgi:hypothetical protein